MGTEEDQTTAFPPHKVIGNIYYVGTRTLSLMVTPQKISHQQHTERNMRTIESLCAARVQVSDVRSCSEPTPGDHQKGQPGQGLTGAQVMVMAEDAGAAGDEAWRQARSTGCCATSR
jgi:hypothetical protein